MDTNEDIYKKNLGKYIPARDGLNMNEVVGTFTGNNIGANLFIGSEIIDAVWETPDKLVIGSCVMPSDYGFGDHRLFVFEFLTYSLIGKTPPQIIRSVARRSNMKIP